MNTIEQYRVTALTNHLGLTWEQAQQIEVSKLHPFMLYYNNRCHIVAGKEDITTQMVEGEEMIIIEL